MSKYVFIYKENDTDDRDCVKYVELGRLGKLECGHYFPSIGLTGACFSTSLRIDEIDFDNITSVLTKDEFEQLKQYNMAIKEIGYGIKEGDEKFNKGIALWDVIKHIIEKLESEENRELFEQVIEEEIEYMQGEYGLNRSEVEEIFDNYGLDYRDRGIVSCVYNNTEEAGREFVDGCYSLDEQIKNYFDYEKFGNDLLEDEQYYELKDGRVVRLNY